MKLGIWLVLLFSFLVGCGTKDIPLVPLCNETGGLPAACRAVPGPVELAPKKPIVPQLTPFQQVPKVSMIHSSEIPEDGVLDSFILNRYDFPNDISTSIYLWRFDPKNPGRFKGQDIEVVNDPVIGMYRTINVGLIVLGPHVYDMSQIDEVMCHELRHVYERRKYGFEEVHRGYVEENVWGHFYEERFGGVKWNYADCYSNAVGEDDQLRRSNIRNQGRNIDQGFVLTT